MAKLTHAQFAERIAYMASQCAQWSGSCLTLPEKVNEPMSAGSVRRFLEEMQARLDYLREDLAELERITPAGRAALQEQSNG